MEEIDVRFGIVELAVKLGDMQTISIQVEKLRNLSLDDNLDEIITLLENRNFRQALFLMKHYASTLKDDFFEEKSTDSAAIEEERDLEYPVRENRIDGGEKVLTLDDLLKMSDYSMQRVKEYRAAATNESSEIFEEDLVAAVSDEGVENELEIIEVSEGGENLAEEYISSLSAELELEDTDRVDGIREESFIDINEEDESIQSVESNDLDAQKESDESCEANIYEESREDADEREEEDEDVGKDELYPPISYIEQKYRNMFHQYAPKEESDVLCEGVEEILRQIAETGYSERDMERFLLRYREHKERGDLVCSAQILLAAAATESKFAQFLLARELFTGDIIEQNHAEAFTQINSLAEKGFAEAICDLAQFYEYGIGIGKDRKMALLLYEEAQEMGVERAARHVERLKKGRGLLGLLKL
jgi:hypothetical protein